MKDNFNKKITPEELKLILQNHCKWLESGGKEGDRANFERKHLIRCNLKGVILEKATLKGANLDGAILIKANLKETDLRGASFKEANLAGVDLRHSMVQEADLYKADLGGAKLNRANFRGANMEGTNLKGVKNLSVRALAGTNLINTKLPDHISYSDIIDYISEASKLSRITFLSLLAASFFCWLTVAITSDGALLTNSSSNPLPIIQARVPIKIFFFVAPVILFGIYIYLHLTLQNLWEALSELPALFPDGGPLYMKVHPWLVSGLISTHVSRLSDIRPPLSSLQAFSSIVVAWCLVPASLTLFWIRYLPIHDWLLTVVHILLVLVSIEFGRCSYRLAWLTLQTKDVFGTTKFREVYKNYSLPFVSVFILSVLSVFAIEGLPFNFFGIKKSEPYAKLDLREKDLSVKLENWNAIENVGQVKRAVLSKKNLRYANAFRAFLVHADLSRTNLQNADLREAMLIGARLQGANLRQANLSMAKLEKARLDHIGDSKSIKRTDLSEANLRGAELKGAILTGAILRKADLDRAGDMRRGNRTNLDEAVLINAILTGAILIDCSLKCADLRGANLENARLKDANLYKANLSPWGKGTLAWGAGENRVNLKGAQLERANLEGANLEGANLQGANLEGTNLKDAKLVRANLYGANLINAKLFKTDLSGADFSSVKGLTRLQIKDAITDAKTILPENLK